MAKCVVAILVVAVAISVQGVPAFGDDIAAAAGAGDWEQVRTLINSGFGQTNAELWKQISSASVKDLKPVPGGQVFGQAEYAFHTSSNINGQKSENSGGHKVINDNGKVTEYDFQPKQPLL